MIVITLTDCPPTLRGDLTKWLQEISTGVYVGRVNSRVREEIWKRVQESAEFGRATMVFNTNNEQGMDFRVHNNTWEPIDFDGLKLMLRPSPARIKQKSDLKFGFSNAAKMRKYRKISNQRNNNKQYPDTYVVVDVETTGLSPIEHEILEIGAIYVKAGQIESTFQAIIKTKTKIPQHIKVLTGLSDEIISKEGRNQSEVISDFLSFAADFPVISHNASFDYQFLRSACEQCGLPLFSNRCIDTLSLARRLVDDVGNYKLTTLLQYFGIEEKGAHRSVNDCLSTKQLYEKLINFNKAYD